MIAFKKKNPIHSSEIMKGKFIVKIFAFYGHGLVPMLQYIGANMM